MLILILLLITYFNAIDVSVMLALDVVTNSGTVNNEAQLKTDFAKLKSGGVKGVMLDVWWGIVETSPKTYNWAPYKTIVADAKAAGLKVQFVTSFHKCGGNVGDTCNIPLPSWVVSAGKSNDAFFKDDGGIVDDEYISFWADEQAVFNGRTPIQMYKDFMSSLKSTFQSYISDGTINEIQVGAGPCGELRYPSYNPKSDWSYCGVGEFQCYDKWALASLQSAATAAGHSEWGKAGPNNAGNYNSRPSSANFFKSGQTDNYASEYGKFFLNWYFTELLNHAGRVLNAAKSVFGSTPIATKVAGIHWWYNDVSHAAELTAGYYNTNNINAYSKIASKLSSYGTTFDFTCLEMTGTDSTCGSTPSNLVGQALNAAKSAGIKRAGENALELCGNGCNTAGFDQIYSQAKTYGLTSFTYLRFTRNLVDNSNSWSQFTSFVSKMNSA